MIGSARDWSGLIHYPVIIGVGMVGGLPVAPVVPLSVLVPVVGAVIIGVVLRVVEQVIVENCATSGGVQVDAEGVALTSVVGQSVVGRGVQADAVVGVALTSVVGQSVVGRGVQIDAFPGVALTSVVGESVIGRGV